TTSTAAPAPPRAATRRRPNTSSTRRTTASAATSAAAGMPRARPSRAPTCWISCTGCWARLGPEAALDRPRRLLGRGRAAVDLEIVGHVLVHARVLPARQAEVAVAARPLACLQQLERRRDLHPVHPAAGQQRAIVGGGVAQQNLVE